MSAALSVIAVRVAQYDDAPQAGLIGNALERVGIRHAHALTRRDRRGIPRMRILLVPFRIGHLPGLNGFAGIECVVIVINMRANPCVDGRSLLLRSHAVIRYLGRDPLEQGVQLITFGCRARVRSRVQLDDSDRTTLGFGDLRRIGAGED